LGRQNRKFANTNSEGQVFANRADVVSSDDGFFRSAKRTHPSGSGKRYSQHSIRPENRNATGIRSNQFSTKRSGSRATGYKNAPYQHRAD